MVYLGADSCPRRITQDFVNGHCLENVHIAGHFHRVAVQRKMH